MLPRFSALFLGLAALQAQQPLTLTVPSAYDNQDAPTGSSVAGAVRSLHQQVLIDASHLAPMAQQTIYGLKLRRDATSDSYAPGTSHLRVTLAESPHDVLSASAVFANNLVTNPTVVFDGSIAVPASGPMTTPTWDTAHTIYVAFTTPFAYSGANLTIDLVGTALASSTDWWIVDAVQDPAIGTVQHLGSACGPYANAYGVGLSASADARTALLGSSMTMWSEGTENGLSFFYLFFNFTGPVPLSSIIPGANVPQGCSIYGLDPPPALLAILQYGDTTLAGSGLGARAQFLMDLPNTPALAGADFYFQSMDLQEFATSNAVRITLGSNQATQGMGLVQGAVTDVRGQKRSGLAPVIQFEYQ